MWRWFPLVAFGCGRVGFGATDLDAQTADTRDAFVDPHLLIHLTFDGPLDTGSADVSGHGHDASCAPPGCPTPTTGPHGEAGHFTAGAFMLISDDPSLFAAQTFSVAAWIRLSTPTGGTVGGKELGGSTSDTFALLSHDTGPTCFETVLPDTISTEYACDPYVMDAGTWHHLAGTYDGTIKRLYLDGTPIATAGSLAVGLDTHPIVIGADMNNDTITANLDGDLDEFRFYDRGLDASEIAALAH